MRSSWLGALLCVGAFVWAAAPAAASAPEILSASASAPALPGETIRVEVVARDADAAVNRAFLAGPDVPEGFGGSACRAPHRSAPARSGPFAAGRKVTFSLPYEPEEIGVQLLEVVVTSGECGGRPRVARRALALQVSLEDLPPLPPPTTSDAPLPVLPLPGPPPARAAAAASCPHADDDPVRTRIKFARDATVCLINAERTARGLRALKGSKKLRKVALRHSADMRRRRYFAHQTPGGTGLADRLRRAGYWPANAGENLALGTASLSTPRTIVDAWMHSDSHRHNILHTVYREVGIGIVIPAATSRSDDGATYTAEFGQRP